MDDDTGWEDEVAAFSIPPPGEEGSFHSHEGDEELFDQIINGAKSKRCTTDYSSIALMTAEYNLQAR